MTASRSAVKASGIKKMPIMEIASSINRGAIISVAKMPKKNALSRFAPMASVTMVRRRGTSSVIISAIIRMMAKKQMEITFKISDQPSSSPRMAD